MALAEAVSASDATQLAPGMFDEDLNVICGQGRLRIIKLKPAGSALMDFKAFVNGWHVRPGDRLVKIEE